MNNKMCQVSDVIELINAGKSLLIAGDKILLDKLPSGNWIGGTIPYFISEKGGEFTQERVFITELPSSAKSFKIVDYDESNLKNIFLDAPENGFTFLIISAFSNSHTFYALNAPSFEHFASSPVIGWVSGFDLNDSNAKAMVFNGQKSSSSSNAVAIHVELPEDKYVDADIINIFEQDKEADTLQFLEDGFSASEVLVNGQKENFINYLKKKNIDTKIPLVADLFGASINTSFMALDEENNVVKFYAPIFKNTDYKIGTQIEDYISEFNKKIELLQDKEISFSCNCILNYLYAGLEGKHTANAIGPITFGEIVYQLLNQTMVYMTIEKK